MGDGTRFSVVCPFYNAEKYLSDAVLSVIHQTYTDWEMILVDDGSTDSSPHIARQYASTDSRIRVMTIVHAGTYNARKAGIEAAVGEYIAFLDSDDYVEPTMLETVSGLLEEYHTDTVVFNWNITGDDSASGFEDDRIEQTERIKDRRILLQRMFVKHSYGFTLVRTVFHRRLFEGRMSGGPVSQRSAEDTYLSYILLSGADSILLVPDALYNYRMNPHSTTHSLTAENYAGKDGTVIQIFEDMDQRYPDLMDEGIGIHVVRSFFAYVIQVPQTTEASLSEYREHCRKLRESTFYNRRLKGCSTGDTKLDVCSRLFRRRQYTVMFVLLKGWKQWKERKGGH